MEESKYYCEGDKRNGDFYMFDKKLMDIEKYDLGLSIMAKVLYMILLDRTWLSIKNKYVDEQGSAYIYYTRKEASDKLRISEKTAGKLFKELEDMDLIEEVRQGQGRANVIFVKKVADEPEIKLIETGKNYMSRTVKSSLLDMYKLPTSNTNINNTKKNHTHQSKDDDEIEVLNLIKNKSKLNEFKENEKELLEEVINTIFYSQSFKVSGQVVDRTVIRQKLQKISKSHLDNLLNVLKEKKDINNQIGYAMKVLYSSLENKIIRLQRDSYQRNYDGFDFDSLLANRNF